MLRAIGIFDNVIANSLDAIGISLCVIAIFNVANGNNADAIAIFNDANGIFTNAIANFCRVIHNVGRKIGLIFKETVGFTFRVQTIA